MTELKLEQVNSNHNELIINTSSNKNSINDNHVYAQVSFNNSGGGLDYAISSLTSKICPLLNCDILDVNGGKILFLSSSSKSFNGDLTLTVRNEGAVGLHGRNTVIISNDSTLLPPETPSANLKVTLVIPAFGQTTIKNTEHLIKFAQSVIDLPMDDVKNIKLGDYNLIRQVKKLNSLSDYRQVSPYKLTLQSPEVKISTYKIERKIDENFYKFYSIFNEVENNIFKDLPVEIIGQIGSYLHDGDIKLHD